MVDPLAMWKEPKHAGWCRITGGKECTCLTAGEVADRANEAALLLEGMYRTEKARADAAEAERDALRKAVEEALSIAAEPAARETDFDLLLRVVGALKAVPR